MRRPIDSVFDCASFELWTRWFGQSREILAITIFDFNGVLSVYRNLNSFWTITFDIDVNWKKWDGQSTQFLIALLLSYRSDILVDFLKFRLFLSILWNLSLNLGNSSLTLFMSFIIHDIWVLYIKRMLTFQGIQRNQYQPYSTYTFWVIVQKRRAFLP